MNLWPQMQMRLAGTRVGWLLQPLIGLCRDGRFGWRGQGPGCDSTRHALYAFDGTWNYSDECPSLTTDAEPTNVRKIWDAYEGTKRYYGGIGNLIEYGLLGTIFGGLGGYGAQGILSRALSDFERIYTRNQGVDIIGFSRGGALALEFANIIVERHTDVQIRFLGLFDVVASIGAPWSDTNPGYRSQLPPNRVRKAVHAIALDEDRRLFPLKSLRWMRQVGFPGNHSDVGGGYAETGLSNITLRWMISQMREAGAAIGDLWDNVASDPSMQPHSERRGMKALLYWPKERSFPTAMIHFSECAVAQ